MGNINYFRLVFDVIVVRAQDKRPTGELYTYMTNVVRMDQNHIVGYRKILGAAHSFRNRYVFPTHLSSCFPAYSLETEKGAASKCSGCVLEN
jgi:hypothetical protein